MLKLLYWVAVLVISLALVVGLILFLESRDEPSLDQSAAPGRRPRPWLSQIVADGA